MEVSVLYELCKPIMEYLKSQGNPYLKIEIDENGARLVQVEAYAPIDEKKIN